ncbi:MAG: hypothetical protein LBD42_01550 [Desulfovibrio sp.]|jgi:hypothetical protein|nr:hypothetical protein [Desulfovibrio sp.]
MRTKFTATLTLLAFCLTASLAFAGVMSFPKFKVNVPDGWEASQEGPTVILAANDKSASISITIAETEGMAIKDLAMGFSQALSGSEPQADTESGGYQFTFKKGAVESDALLTVEGKNYLLLVVTGENPQIQNILGSLEEK